MAYNISFAAPAGWQMDCCKNKCGDASGKGGLSHLTPSYCKKYDSGDKCGTSGNGKRCRRYKYYCSVCTDKCWCSSDCPKLPHDKEGTCNGSK